MSTTINTNTNTNNTNNTNSATRIVRRSGTNIPAYFLGRPRDRWTEAFARFPVELATAA